MSTNLQYVSVYYYYWCATRFFFSTKKQIAVNTYASILAIKLFESFTKLPSFRFGSYPRTSRDTSLAILFRRSGGSQNSFWKKISQQQAPHFTRETTIMLLACLPHVHLPQSVKGVHPHRFFTVTFPGFHYPPSSTATCSVLV